MPSLPLIQKPPSPPAAQDPQRKPPRQPMLWAALSYSSGIVTGVHAWRPASWWVAAAIAFLAAGLYFVQQTQVASSQPSPRCILPRRRSSHPAPRSNRSSRPEPSAVRWPATRDDRSRHTRRQIPRRRSQRNQTEPRRGDRRDHHRKRRADPRAFRRAARNLQHPPEAVPCNHSARSTTANASASQSS